MLGNCGLDSGLVAISRLTMRLPSREAAVQPKRQGLAFIQLVFRDGRGFAELGAPRSTAEGASGNLRCAVFTSVGDRHKADRSFGRRVSRGHENADRTTLRFRQTSNREAARWRTDDASRR